MTGKRNRSVTAAKRLAILAVCTALASIFGYLDGMIPMPIPGMKLGLSNIVVLMLFYLLGPREAAVVMALKVIMGALLYGSGMSGFLYSASGGFLAYLAMLLSIRRKVDMRVASMLGAVMHNVGQVAVAAAVMGTPNLLYYLSVLIVLGVATGLCTGISAKLTLKYLRKIKLW